VTPAEFKRKWSRYSGKESSAYQEHFSDLCRLLATAYGWPVDLSDNQILERLLALNLDRSAKEKNQTSPKRFGTSREKNEDELL
jgi:hypothetical protein